MTVGLAAAVANGWLDNFRNNAVSARTVYVSLHTGDPGSAGTANASAVTTRRQATWGAASAGSMTLTSMASTYSMTSSETISHIALWDASSSGNFLQSAALTTSQAVVNGSVISITTLTLAYTPIAA